ncbi:kinase-like protein [Tothia fuscella]|uniref:non-specific serine/threonine protein kinase n=1 Tax=Tothia fuscella TaxID=1048955 RepID=A0A9P4P1N3_9PEZI|nr:kinase-like protein [Tothia fuscella]
MDRNSRGIRRPAPPAMPEPVIIGDYERSDEIGKGSFAMVFRGVHVKKGALVAIKSVNVTKLSKKLRDNLEEEVNILKSLHHPHIVALFSCRESRTQMHLIMEFCELGDLSSFIRKRDSSKLRSHPALVDMFNKYPCPKEGALNEVVTRHFAQQIGSALEFMRTRNLLHRDIKPQNLLLVPSAVWTSKYGADRAPLMVDEQQEGKPAGIASLPMLKVADFGFARHLPSLTLAETLCGSPLYMAPEILRYEKYDAAADLWSVGTVLHEMVTGRPPFRAANHMELLRKIEKNDDKIKFPDGVQVSRAMKNLIRALLMRAPVTRISYVDFFNDPVIKGEIPGLVGEDIPVTARAESESSGVYYDTVERREEPELAPKQPPVSRRLSIREATRDVVDRREAPKSPLAGEPSRPRERRPTLTSHTTAPATSRVPPAAAAAMERRNSRAAPPGPSMLKEHLNRERGVIDEKALREAREHAAQDIAFERDYVVVEKRQVEVNAFADELANSPHVQGQREQQGQMIRRATTTGTPLSQTAPQSRQSNAMQIINRQAPLHSRGGSYERRYGRSPTSATSAISKALNMASLRVLGLGFSPPLGKGPSPPQGYNPYPSYPIDKSESRLIGDGRQKESPDEDVRIVIHLEKLANRSDTVWGFAEVKYQQIIPSPPLHPHGLGIADTKNDDEAIEEEDLTVDQMVAVSEEALVLFVKTLSILTNLMKSAAFWWEQRNRGEVIDAPRSAPVRSNSQNMGTKVNGVVQWARNKFNDCLEKSEVVGRKLVDAQKKLPQDDPGHPSNHPSNSQFSANSIGTSTDHINLTTGITAEKLMYDRAIEMSRSAALNELTNENIEGGILSYRTAISLMEAIIDHDEDLPGYRKPLKDDRAEEDIINGLDPDDWATVKTMIKGMKERLRSLRSKQEAQKANRRALTAAAAAPKASSGRNSSSATPQMANTPPK